ncbi:MAG: DUF805 domain-containing protein [Cohaesibacter sp.]|nr:DUF805 domain-containing protein [Cohaesibacter sp.]
MKILLFALKDGFVHSLDWKAKASGANFWLFFFIFSMLFFAALGADVTYIQEPETPAFFPSLMASLFASETPFTRLALLLFTLPMISFAIRRIFDQDKPSWAGMGAVLPFMSLAFLLIFEAT